MNILILFEESGTIRDYAIDQGHQALSVDLLPGRGKYVKHHLQYDVWDLIYQMQAGSRFIHCFDLVIAHPPCTALAVSGNRWYANSIDRQQAIWQIEQLWALPVPLCIENPVGVLSTKSALGKPAQYIQPWQFGHAESKKTGLWLHGLSPLVETDNVYEAMMQLPLKDRTKVHYASPGPNRSRDRSKTYEGIGQAMIDQWT